MSTKAAKSRQLSESKQPKQELLMSIFLPSRSPGFEFLPTFMRKHHPSPSLLQLALLTNGLVADLYKLILPTDALQALKQSLAQHQRLPSREKQISLSLVNLLEVRQGVQAQKSCPNPHWLGRNAATDNIYDPQPKKLEKTTTELELATHRTSLAFQKGDVIIIMFCITYFLTSPSCPANNASTCLIFLQATSSIIPSHSSAKTLLWDAMCN